MRPEATWSCNIQRVDQEVLNVWWRIERGEDYSFVSDPERHKIPPLLRLADQFRRCDKYVFVTCGLNLWFPAEFKIYIDAIGIPDPNSRTTPLVAKSMFPGQCKKSLHVHACSPNRVVQEQELSFPPGRCTGDFGRVFHRAEITRGKPEHVLS